jgi:hypothetical protein
MRLPRAAAAELRQGQVGGEFPAAEPHRTAAAGGVIGQGDGVPGDFAGIAGAAPLADQEAGVGEAGEELLLAGGARSSGADRPPEHDPRCLRPAFPAGLLVFRAGGAAGGGPVAGGGAPQPVAFLRGPARLTDPVPLVRQPRLAAVLTGQHRDDVDVIGSVADGDPAAPVVLLPAGRQASAVHDVPGDLRPLVIGQHPVFGGGADGAVPDRAIEAARPEHGVRLLEQAAQAAEVAAAVRAQRRLQLGRVPPPGDQMRIGVLLAPPRPEQIPDQPADPRPARIADLGDHRSLLRISSVAASSRSARRRLSAAYGRRSPERWPVAFSFATA